MYRQMSYVTTRDLGYNKDQVLVIPTFTGWTDEGETTVNRLNQALLGVQGVVRVTGTSASFNRGWSRNGFEIGGEEHTAFTYRIHEGYLETLGLELAEGRDFDPYRPSDVRNAILVNEALMRDFGWDQPVGEHLYWREDSSSNHIIGVVKDYHFQSLENAIEPVILYFNPGSGKITTALIKILPDDIPGTVARIGKIWKSIFPNRPFEYNFLDDDVARQYSRHQQWMKIMGSSTALAIFIACLGLFGLSGINAVNKLKEMSIRKVLGATGSQLFLRMNREVVLLAFVSFLIAIPVSHHIMSGWLQSFRYNTGLSWTVFLISMVVGIIVAVMTVSYHALRVSNANPAEILRDE
jgi:putative ABC transport system permease protein